MQGQALNIQIENCLSTFSQGWVAMDFRTFAGTVDIFMYDPLIAEPWTRLHTIPFITAATKSGLPNKIIAQQFHNPTALREIFYFDLLMAKEAKAGIPVYLQIFNFFSELLKSWCLKDPYTENGNNIIHNEKEVRAMLANCQTATPEIARALGKLSNACYNIAYGLYSDMNPQLVYDSLGPYYQSDGKLFALKIFHNLQAPELWPETKNLPVSKIDIGCLFENVTLSVDSASHATYLGDQINGLRGWWLLADGKNHLSMKLDFFKQPWKPWLLPYTQKLKC